MSVDRRKKEKKKKKKKKKVPLETLVPQLGWFVAW